MDNELNLDLMLVENSPEMIRFVEQTPEVCLAAVKRDGYMLKHIDQQSPLICFHAIMQSPDAVEHINHNLNKLDENNSQHQKLINLGWKDGDLLKLQLFAFKKNYSSYSKIKNPSIEFSACIINMHYSNISLFNNLTELASLLTDDTIRMGLESNNRKHVDKFEIIKKIRESNAIAKKINKVIENSENTQNNHQKRPRI